MKIPYRGEALSDVLQYLKNNSGNVDVVDWLKRELRHGVVRPGGTHHLLLHLPCSTLITTNYDDLIEQTAAATGRSLQSATDGRTFAHLYRSRQRSDIALGYVHGSFLRRRGLVATTDDFITSYGHSGARWRAVLAELFRKQTIIFIGYSLRDFTTWTSYISTRLSTKHQENSRRLHWMIAPNAGEHYGEYWTRYGVKYIPLTAGQFLTALHADLGTLRQVPIAAAAVAAASGHSLRHGRRLLTHCMANEGWNASVAADKLIGEICDQYC